MDTSVAPLISKSTTRNQLHFKGPYFCQNWSLPDSIIYFLAKNPSSSKLCPKLIQSCKYFFSKNPIIVCSELCFHGRRHTSMSVICNDGETKLIDLKNISRNFWITDVVSILPQETAIKNLMSFLIPNIYQCDIKKLYLRGQFISFNELLFLASKADYFYLMYSTVKNEDGSVVPVEKIIEACIQVKKFEIFFKENDSSISSKTAENLIKIPHFSSIDRICLNYITEVFDIETFFAYIKKNKHTSFSLYYYYSISDAYRNRLAKIVDEIIKTENLDYKPPMINFKGLYFEHRGKLRSIVDKFIFTTF